MERAESIVQHGPDPDIAVQFGEPIEGATRGWSTYRAGSPEALGDAAEYARSKARQMADPDNLDELYGQGGPVILQVDVPEDVVERVLEILVKYGGKTPILDSKSC